MNEKLEQIKARVIAMLRESPLAERFENDVEIDPVIDNDGDEFLRVQITWHPPRKEVDDELIRLLERIEESVGEIDPRHPSVRFLDAA